MQLILAIDEVHWCMLDSRSHHTGENCH